MVDEVISCISVTRTNIDTAFLQWYGEIPKLAENVGVEEAVPRKTSLQRNRCNVPSESPQDHYEKAVAIPLQDYLLSEMEERFSKEGRHARGLLCPMPSINLTSTLDPFKYMPDMLKWQCDLTYPQS